MKSLRARSYRASNRTRLEWLHCPRPPNQLGTFWVRLPVTTSQHVQLSVSGWRYANPVNGRRRVSARLRLLTIITMRVLGVTGQMKKG